MTAAILRGNALNLPLGDDTVDLVVTSPPYFGLRSYEDQGEHYAGQLGAEPSPAAYLEALLEATREMIRVVKPSGSIFVNLGDKYSDRAGPAWAGSSDRLTGRPPKPRRTSSTSMAPRKSLLGLPWRYALACVDELGLLLRAEVVWSKPNPLPDGATDRVARTHEQVFHFTQGPRYYADLKPLRTAPSSYRRQDAQRSTPPGQRPRALSDSVNPDGRAPSSVWSIPSQPLKVPEALGVDHHAAFPMELPRRIIRGFSPPAGVVLDPLGGTGTTALVADALGRRGITLDHSADYCRVARWRTTDPAQRASALEVAAPAPVADDQLDLLELA